jgi:hypothetical protein
MTFAVHRFATVGRPLRRGDLLEGFEQMGLVGFDLGEDGVPGLFGAFKGFFDNAGHRR